MAFGFVWGFFDSTTLAQQANTGPPAAPQNMAASAAACQVPSPGPDAHLHSETRDHVKEKGWHCIQGARFVRQEDLAYDHPIVLCFKSRCTLESKYPALLMVGRKKDYFNRISF